MRRASRCVLQRGLRQPCCGIRCGTPCAHPLQGCGIALLESVNSVRLHNRLTANANMYCQAIAGRSHVDQHGDNTAEHACPQVQHVHNWVIQRT